MKSRNAGPPKNPPDNRPHLEVVRPDRDLAEEVASAGRAARASAKAAKDAAKAAEAHVQATTAPPTPQDLDAEKHVLGALLLQGSLWPQVAELVEERDFFAPHHAEIFKAMGELVSAHKPIDSVTLADQLREMEARGATRNMMGIARLRAHGGEAYFAELMNVVATVDNIAFHARIINGKARLRRLIETADELKAQAFGQHGRIDEFLANAELSIAEATAGKASATRALLRGSDVELGRAILDVLRRGGERLVYDLAAFWRYVPDKGIWRQVPESEVDLAVSRFDGLHTAKGEELSLISSRITGARKLASVLAARPNFFSADEDGENAPPAGLSFRNGFARVTAAGVELSAHAAAHRQTATLPYPYDPEAKAPLWEAFLQGVFRDDEDREEKIDVFQEFAGIALLGLAPRYQKAMLFTGGGDNGKGVATDVFFELVPQAMRAAIPPQQLESEYARAALSMALLNAVSEMPGKEIIASEPLKAAISGDLMQGRHPAGRLFFFRPRAAHLYSANNLPATADQSRGFWRRFIVLEFRRSFEFDPARDPNLKEKILAGELAGIAAWALRGAVRMLGRNRYNVPRSSAAALEKWRKSTDPVSQFVEECCTATDGPKTMGSLLFKTYLKWAERTNHKYTLNRNRFAERLEGLGFKRSKLHEGNFWNIDATEPE